MNEKRLPAPRWSLEGEAVGCWGPSAGPPLHLGYLPLRVGPPLCAVSALPGRGHRSLHSCPCCDVWAPGLLAVQSTGAWPHSGLPVPQTPVSPAGPGGAPGAQAGGPLPLGLQVGHCCSVPHLWTGSQGAVPWVRRAGGQGVGRSVSCPGELLAWGWGCRQGLSGPRWADAHLSLGLGPTGQAARPRHTAGIEPGEGVSMWGGPREPLDSARKSTGCLLGLHFRYSVS